MVTTPDEDVLLALLNTTPMVAGERTDVLADPARALAWLDRQSGAPGRDEDFEFLRATRDCLQQLISEGTGLAALAPALVGVSYRAAVGDNGITWELTLPTTRGVAARAVVAWDALERRSPGRIRPCENTAECSLFLIDHSKGNSARWCSMAGCGNRMKVRRHYERQRAAKCAD
ncbi:CGNR zinc finger domain-containing protein [Mycobacterium shigaense]|uniref:Zinc finger CGNR domain-containing protein n=1 Tax=Mycobacterium shigaense TaxID=722731 RepID=A0A1Z4EEW0_9MYCO|nr:CGNR zinc finger domain-containing protein [Mycobacterium shigaense]MEA1122009.1 CGNR zinc finger domain-containing protein [Mycobacterium shigaense]BAX91450.1 hypothetical protein MSG_01292 [Mycobacterium shigaense]